MDLSLARINQILVIARAGSFSRAAAELNLSQPALSRSVALLEKRYGVQFFERRRTGVALTPSGAQIIGQMERIRRDVSSLDHNLRLQARGEAGNLDLGIGATVASMILADIGVRLFTARPRVQLRTLIRPGDVLLEALLEDEIDLFIAPGIADMPREIETETVGAISAAFIVRPGHPLAAAADVGLDEVLDFPLAAPAEIPWIAQDGGAPQGVFICSNTHVTQKIVLESDMVWISQTHTIANELRDGLLVELKVAGSPLESPDSPFAESEVVIGSLAGRTISPLANEVIRLCRECFAGARSNG
jgi:DNA-binding transcriptional LysR family regulator